MKKFFDKKLKGLSLLECSISIAIIGFLLIIMSNYLKIINYQNNIDITNQKINYIRKSMQGYLARNGFLPYASNNLLGVQKNDCNVGFIPYKTLGISSYFLYDGFGKKIKFIVNKNLVLKNHLHQNKFIIPIQLPIRFYYCENSVSWHRLFYFESKDDFEYLKYYDCLNENYNINIIKNKEKLKLDFLECDPAFMIPYLEDENFIQNMNAHKKQYIVKDLIAWAVVSENFKNDNLNIDYENLIFFQTRFNMASQLKYPVVTNGVFLPSSFYLDFELLNNMY